MLASSSNAVDRLRNKIVQSIPQGVGTTRDAGGNTGQPATGQTQQTWMTGDGQFRKAFVWGRTPFAANVYFL